MVRVLAFGTIVLALLCVSASASVVLSIPTNADSGVPGGTVHVPITVSEGTGIESAELVVGYDTNVLSFQSVATGTLTSDFFADGLENTSGWVTLTSNIMANPAGSGAGSILNLTFGVKPGASLGETSLTLLPVEHTVGGPYGLNEGTIPVSNYVGGSVNVVPEPSTLAMLLSLVAAGFWTAFRPRKDA